MASFWRWRCLPTMLRLRRSFAFNVIDAHFAYPEGYAATLLGTVVACPGDHHACAAPKCRSRAIRAGGAGSIAGSAARDAYLLGIRIAQASRDDDWASPATRSWSSATASTRASFIGSTEQAARQRAWRAPGCTGAGIRRRAGRAQGFSPRDRMPAALRRSFPRTALPRGGRPGAGRRLECAAAPRRHRSWDCRNASCFLGTLPPEDLNVPLSAADVFVLATRNEGWANVFPRGHGLRAAGGHDRRRWQCRGGSERHAGDPGAVRPCGSI